MNSSSCIISRFIAVNKTFFTKYVVVFFPNDLISRFFFFFLQTLLSAISFVSRLTNSSTVGKNYLKLLFREFFGELFPNCSWKLLVCSRRFVSALWPMLKCKCYLTPCGIRAIRAIHCSTIFFGSFITLFIEMIYSYRW